VASSGAPFVCAGERCCCLMLFALFQHGLETKSFLFFYLLSSGEHALRSVPSSGELSRDGSSLSSGKSFVRLEATIRIAFACRKRSCSKLLSHLSVRLHSVSLLVRRLCFTCGFSSRRLGRLGSRLFVFQCLHSGSSFSTLRTRSFLRPDSLFHCMARSNWSRASVS
jgi:hypothetical protein